LIGKTKWWQDYRAVGRLVQIQEDPAKLSICNSWNKRESI